MSAAPARWLLFCEAVGDAHRVHQWVDELLVLHGAVRGPEAFVSENGVSLRQWIATTPATPPGWVDLHRHREITRELRIAPWYGHFGGVPAEPDAVMHANLLRIARELVDRGNTDNCPTAVVIVRDQDHQRAERSKGAQQASEHSPLPEDVPVVVGLPVPELEAWVLAGFVPADEAERALLDKARARLGFLPNEQPERLTSKKETDKRDAKAALAAITAGEGEREAECLRIQNHDRRSLLLRRGRECGLADFIEQVETKLVPQVDSTAPSRIRRQTP